MAALDDLIQQVSDPELRTRLQQEADRLAKQKKFGLVFEDHIPECTPLYDIPIRRNSQVALKNGEVNDIYRVAKIRGNQAVSKHNFRLPEILQVKRDNGGIEYTNHLYVDEESGAATFNLNLWEVAVLEEESRNPDFVCWLRNVSRQHWSLCIPYEMEGKIHGAYPDFIIVRMDRQSGGGYIIDILEPHTPALKDNLGKAKAFAKYAEENIGIGRFQLIRMVSDTLKDKRLKRLDFSKGVIRQKVLQAMNTDEIDHIFDEYGFFE